MKTMTMEKAVEYCKDKRVAIHTPTQEVYDKFGKYVKKIGTEWLSENLFSEYEHDICVNLECNHSCYADLSWYKENNYEIIELISDATLTITIKSDGHKTITATCNDITVKAKCNDSDTFNLSKGSHIALKRLIDKMNEPAKEDKSNKIEKGDIVEILDSSYNIKESIGLQGIVLDGSNCPSVKLPISVNGDNVWAYDIEDLKLIRKAQ